MRFKKNHPFFVSRILALILLGSLIGCQTAPQSSSVQKIERKPWATPYYLTEVPFPIDSVIPAPPVDGSEADRKDFETIQSWQNKRTPDQCELARIQEIPSMKTIFGRKETLNKGLPDFDRLKPEVYQALFDFFRNFHRDVSFVSEELKQHYKRKRPYFRNESILPCIKKETSFAYPSGHASIGIVGAEILSELFPKNRVALEKAGIQSGLNRVIGGVHHPSDVEAGHVYAKKFLEVIRKNPRFISDLNEMKKKL